MAKVLKEIKEKFGAAAQTAERSFLCQRLGLQEILRENSLFTVFGAISCRMSVLATAFGTPL